jgi:hypothetical protein
LIHLCGSARNTYHVLLRCRLVEWATGGITCSQLTRRQLSRLDHPHSFSFIFSFKTEYTYRVSEIPSFIFTSLASIIIYFFPSSQLPTPGPTRQPLPSLFILSTATSHPSPLSLPPATSSPPPASGPPDAGRSRGRAGARGRRPCSPCGGRRRGGPKGSARIHMRTGWIHGGSTDLELGGGRGRRWEQGGAAVGARRHVGDAGHAG